STACREIRPMPGATSLPNDGGKRVDIAPAPVPKAATSGDGRRLKLVVAYDGAPFRGWHSQAGGNTIQDHLENAFAQVAGESLRLHGAGRTDAGVHALGQCAHVELPSTRLPPETWRNALNASLPPQIRVVSCRLVRASFHARFSARGKVYRYRIATTPVLFPFEIDRAWHVAGEIDDTALRACAALFAGRHDFAGFCANRGSPAQSTVRTIRSVKVRRTKSATVIEFDGDGFLYKMVRLMVGAMVRCGLGKERPRDVRERLRSGLPAEARLVAPAGGLTLVRVHY
ncbi:MAG: tRNA pseudouridine(38-40) synthase TruA, partial [Rhodanobacteraceae bacterium]